MIKVHKTGESTFEVAVEGRLTTKHHVTVDPSYGRKLTGGRVSPEELVVKSFEFLLEREPNTSILRSFDLSVISQYFPEYENEIRKELR
jgi:hypothetical protein